MARPSKLSEPVVNRLCEAIRKGATYERACDYAGISYSTFNGWIQQAETAKSGQFLKFLEAIRTAEGEAAKRWLDIIDAAALNDGNWKAAAWMLSRRYPKDYGTSVQQVTGDDGAPLTIKIEYADVSDSNADAS